VDSSLALPLLICRALDTLPHLSPNFLTYKARIITLPVFIGKYRGLNETVCLVDDEISHPARTKMVGMKRDHATSLKQWWHFPLPEISG